MWKSSQASYEISAAFWMEGVKKCSECTDIWKSSRK